MSRQRPKEVKCQCGRCGVVGHSAKTCPRNGYAREQPAKPAHPDEGMFRAAGGNVVGIEYGMPRHTREAAEVDTAEFVPYVGKPNTWVEQCIAGQWTRVKP